MSPISKLREQAKRRARHAWSKVTMVLALAAILIFGAAAYTNQFNAALGNAPGNMSGPIIVTFLGVLVLVAAAMHEKLFHRGSGTV